MNYITTAQAAQKWGITANRVFKLISTGRIPEAVKMGSIWMIPECTEKPVDGRTKAAKTKAPATDTNDFFRYPVFEHRNIASFNPPLTPEELQIKKVLETYHACRFEEAEELLADLTETSNKYHRIVAYYMHCMLDAALVKTNDFLRHYSALTNELEGDFPHNREMRQYLFLIEAAFGGNNYYSRIFRVDPEYQYDKSFLPRLGTLCAFSLSLNNKEHTAMDLSSYELGCKLLESSDIPCEAQSMHAYLGTRYFFSGMNKEAHYHIRAVLQLAKRYEMFFVPVTEYFYLKKLYESVLSEFSPEFREHIVLLSNDMHDGYVRLLNAFSLSSVYKLMLQGDYIFLLYAVHGYTNKEVANLLHISKSSVGKKYSDIYNNLGIGSKKELVEIYQSFLSNTLNVGE